MNGRGGGNRAPAEARTSDFLMRALRSTADTVRAIDGGWVVLTPSLPQVWSLNHLRLDKAHSPVAALELADEQLTSVPYRHLVTDADELGRALLEPLRRKGFAVEREVVMVIADDARARPGRPDAVVIEPDEQTVVALERRWLVEDDRTTVEAVDDLIEAGLREGRAWGERRFGIAEAGGALAAMTKLRSDGRTAQVEDVYTAPEARGRGFASTLVSHAVTVAQEAGNDLVFIVADDCDWPKQLYARLGFRPIARRWAFHRG